MHLDGLMLKSFTLMAQLTASALLLASIHLVERRGRTEKLNPKRQVEIATVLESIPEAVILFDVDGHVLDANSAAEQLAGIPREELLRSTAQELKARVRIIYGEVQGNPFPTSILRRALLGETIRYARLAIERPEQQSTLETVVSASPMRGNDSEVVGAIVIVRDITELVGLQRRLADTERHRAVGQMAAGIAHDFNNVLDAIEQALFLVEMNNDKSPEERRSYIRMIERAVRRGAEISNRVREYLRTGTSDRTDVYPNQLMEDVLDMTGSVVHRSGNITVARQLNESGPVCGNAADLRRVFTNLIFNALEAMPNGGTLSVTTEQVDGKVRVTVSDTGMGIPPEHRRRIFNPYFTTKKEGTGLGLSGAHRIITALGGTIRFNTEVGKGTTFIVELPIQQSKQASGERDRSERHVA